ncbi:MAG: glycosyltransferase family 4 protein [Dysgonamonadaceae bacterium]|jgi:glycosyltransferase involved in cell wall biosynthesis|nr:glycosyltransferase family 4 protein [Dysgonamonadaceae bacterium]
MKIILLTDQLIQSDATFIVGGWIQSLISILQNSKKMEIAVVGMTAGNTCFEKKQNITYYKIRHNFPNPLKRIYRRWRRTIQDDSEIKEYISAINDFNPDIVHIFGTENFLCNIIPLIQYKAVVHLQGLINPYSNAWFPPGISEHTLNLHSFRMFDFLKGNGLYHKFETFKVMARRESDYFSFIRFVMGRTDWDKSMSNLLIKNAQYFHLEESLRPDFYTDLQWTFKKKDEIRLISVLSANAYKGFDVILKTAHILKSHGLSFRWTVCGASEKDNVIRTMEKILKKKYKENNVAFLGKKTSEELRSLLLDSDIFIHPSYIENSPNSICEAQILGMPVIASCVGGIPSLIQQNETGILFPANDVFLLSETIISLISDSQRMMQLGKNARVVAQKRHDRDAILKNIENIYREIIEL